MAREFDKLDSELKKVSRKDKKLYIADFESLVDLVKDNGKIKFLTFDEEILEQIRVDGQTYYPPDTVDWLLPNARGVLGEFTQHSDVSDGSRGCTYCQEYLYPLLISYFKQFSETPTEYHYHYLTLSAFHSYLIESFNYSPILFLVATKGRGKTPTLKSLAYIARRGIFTETFREPNLIRWSSDYKASLFFDVKNFPKRVEINNCEDLIYGRAERGVKSSRVLHPEKGPFQDMRTFTTFGVTGATSNYMVDEITEARCVVFVMPFSLKIFNIEPVPELGLSLKAKLTAFRMAHLHTPFIQIDKEKPGKLENYMRGYHQMVKTFFPLYEKYFLEFKKIIAEEKQEIAGNSFEARIIKLVDSLKHSVEDGTLCLTYQTICQVYNAGRDKEISDSSMSNILKNLGFKSKKNSAGTLRGIFYDEEFIKYLKLSYGLEEISPQSASELSDRTNIDPSSTENEKLRSNKNIDELSPDEQLTLGKEIFGEGAKWEDEK